MGVGQGGRDGAKGDWMEKRFGHGFMGRVGWGHNFVVPGDIARKISKPYLGYWQRLLTNFTPIGEVPVDRTVTEQKKQRKLPILTYPTVPTCN